MTHNLSDKNTYPSHHLYMMKDGINIYTKTAISAGDKVVVGGREYRLKLSKHHDGRARKSHYHDGRKRVKYYEFAI